MYSYLNQKHLESKYPDYLLKPQLGAGSMPSPTDAIRYASATLFSMFISVLLTFINKLLASILSFLANSERRTSKNEIKLTFLLKSSLVSDYLSSLNSSTPVF